MSPKKTDKDITKTDLAYKAYSAIRQMLFYNEILPGQKIKYKDLANRIGVSMTPVIHALKWLEFRNIVRHEANKGYYVNEVSLKEITEIYNTRLLIEVSLVPAILEKMNPAGLKRLKKALDDHGRAVAEDNYYRRIMTDMGYHMCLASLADCKIQLNMLQELFDVLLLRYSRNLYFSSVMETSLNEHCDIFESLEKKDKKGLDKALTFHITTVRDHITEGMAKLIVDEQDSFGDGYLF
ncbi:putative HTH-type transcriptional regulator [Desulforapulum autotrophicum HRM2]|uniref:HTH-type transcriptional regulator n=1 Tax=Desulforapulum autotrophicum (strain ATCC 43914 / DSM 3382 / VKM B-1955 / HRM2) TaxID=177437 RepID=C0QJW4_DESAH|nr:GntR family transcriptional regulator [Desulforapulum autotrophicum]ACN15990.1 putative HTH-type transcriptional regulator [Desulforapulum autotrophicum HRM2]